MSGRIVTHRSRGNYNPNYNKQDYIISNRDTTIAISDTKATTGGLIALGRFFVEARSLICPVRALRRVS